MAKIGIAFPDFITTEKINRRRAPSDFLRNAGNRPRVLLAILIIFCGVLIFRLFSLQIIEGRYFRNLANSNRVKTVIIHAPRGVVTDRWGQVLVRNVPGFRKVISGKTKLLSKEEALAEIAKGEKGLEIDSLRFYPYKESLAHVLGYIGQIDPQELKNPSYSGYLGGDLIGKFGIEKEYENFLRGIDGRELIEINNTGEEIRKLGKSDPISGRNINLTVDLALQEKAYKALNKVKKGAVIATTPEGEVLTIISKPSFDPNLFTMGDGYKTSSESSYQNLDQILSDSTNQPLLNRSISGLYPPGSTFKLVVAASGLTNKIIDESYSITDTGVIRVGEFSFSNWFFTGYGKTDGEVNVVKGIKRSNDIFFYKLAEKIGVEAISAMAEKIGLGKTLGIDLEGEAKGIVPTPEWKLRNIGEQWYLGDTYHYGIGQGFLLTTPLEVNAWTQVIANGGTMYRPHLLKNMGRKVESRNLIDAKTHSLITQGMVESCSTGGVAWPLFDFKVKNPNLKIDGKNFLEVKIGSSSAVSKTDRKISVACKTGTAEHEGRGDPHAWITLFAPAHNPQIVLTVLAETSGEGSNVAAPIAKEILTEWFTNERK